LLKACYKVTVISDCITSYDKKKIPEMLHYYESKGSEVMSLNDLIDANNVDDMDVDAEASRIPAKHINEFEVLAK